ncbi:MAG: YitT family protein, partial [Parabacteroides sp.]|nr:YitT family protein [Parabacteroides sp.]
MRKKRKQISQLYYAINDYLLIALGLVLYAFGWTAFILSNEIVTGGVTGICALIFFSTGLPVSVSYIAINIVLLIIAFKVLGAKYLIKTVFG